MVGHVKAFGSYARRQVIEVMCLISRQTETTQQFVVVDGVDGDLFAGSIQQREQFVADRSHAEYVDIFR